MTYRIISFDEQSGQIQIEVDELPQRLVIDLPIEDGKYPEGDILDNYIRGFIPVWTITRKERIKKGIKNSDYIKSLVTKPRKKQVKSKDLANINQSIKLNYLYRTDWTQLPDSPCNDEQKEKWRIYRQAIRDIDVTIDKDIEWPDPPIEDQEYLNRFLNKQMDY
jgi:hypothetical protein